MVDERAPPALRATGPALLSPHLPAIPAALTTAVPRGPDQESQQPRHKNDDRDPPERLERETGTEKNQGEQQNQNKMAGSRRFPPLQVPRGKRLTHRIPLCLSRPRTREFGFVLRARPDRDGRLGAVGPVQSAQPTSFQGQDLAGP